MSDSTRHITHIPMWMLWYHGLGKNKTIWSCSLSVSCVWIASLAFSCELYIMELSAGFLAKTPIIYYYQKHQSFNSILCFYFYVCTSQTAQFVSNTATQNASYPCEKIAWFMRGMRKVKITSSRMLFLRGLSRFQSVSPLLCHVNTTPRAYHCASNALRMGF